MKHSARAVHEQQEKAAKAAHKVMEEKQKEIESKLEQITDYTFTEADKQRALRKMTIAAMNYDKNHPGKSTCIHSSVRTW
jgi:hypothetical protein